MSDDDPLLDSQSEELVYLFTAAGQPKRIAARMHKIEPVEYGEERFLHVHDLGDVDERLNHLHVHVYITRVNSGGEVELLLQKRKDDRPLDPGMWGKSVGGHFTVKDAVESGAVLREKEWMQNLVLQGYMTQSRGKKDEESRRTLDELIKIQQAVVERDYNVGDRARDAMMDQMVVGMSLETPRELYLRNIRRGAEYAAKRELREELELKQGVKLKRGVNIILNDERYGGLCKALESATTNRKNRLLAMRSFYDIPAHHSEKRYWSDGREDR